MTYDHPLSTQILFVAVTKQVVLADSVIREFTVNRFNFVQNINLWRVDVCHGVVNGQTV